MTTAVEFAPLVPWWAIAAFAAAGLLLAGFVAWRGGQGALGRAVAVALLAFAAGDPTIVNETRDPKPDIAVVAVDRSESQSIGVRSARTDAALATLREKLATFGDLEVREVAVEADPGADGTQLMTAVGRVLTEVPTERLAGVILITDGRVHDADAAAPLAGPLHTLLTGERDEVDRRVVLETAPEYGIAGNSVTVAYRVEDRPAGTGTASVRIRSDGRVIDTRNVPVGIRQQVEVPLERAGRSVVEIEAAPLSDEITDRNNRAVVSVQAVRDRLRVLLVSGRPHGGERVWRNLLKSDPSVDLVHFTILRTVMSRDQTPTEELSLIFFPVRELFEERLKEFDLIVFDRYQLRDLVASVYLDNVRRYVHEGGALLLAVGSEFAGPDSLYFSPLGDVIPGRPTGKVEEAGFSPRVNDLGRRHPVTSAIAGSRTGAAPWGRWFRQVEVRDPEGKVLMDGLDGAPLLVTSRVDEGRTALLASDHVWLWSRGFEGGGPYGELMRRLVHWLLKEPELEEEALRASVADGKVVVERQSLSPDPATVSVVAPSGGRQDVALTPGANGIARSELTAAETGLYRIEEGDRRAFVAVGPANPREWTDPRTTAEVLKPVADEKGGGIHMAERRPARNPARRSGPRRGGAGLVRP